MTTVNIEPPAANIQAQDFSGYEDVQQMVDSWPPVASARLAQHIITTLVPDDTRRPKKSNSVAEIFGRMAIEGVPAPSDDDVKRMIEEYRRAKYA